MTDGKLTGEEKRTLLAVARAAITARLVQGGSTPEIPASPGLTTRSGAFVTLHKKGSLRGCIGRFEAEEPIPHTVAQMAQAAAFEDPRFPPLTAGELKDIDLEISVLTPMRRIPDIREIQVGRHGIYIIQGWHRGVLLPQVATEYGWDRQTFLEHTCQKAGLNKDCWRRAETEIYIFSAEVFGEKD